MGHYIHVARINRGPCVLKHKYHQHGNHGRTRVNFWGVWGVPSIEPFLVCGWGAGQRALSTPPPEVKARLALRVSCRKLAAVRFPITQHPIVSFQGGSAGVGQFMKVIADSDRLAPANTIGLAPALQTPMDLPRHRKLGWTRPGIADLDGLAPASQTWMDVPQHRGPRWTRHGITDSDGLATTSRISSDSPQGCGLG